MQQQQGPPGPPGPHPVQRGPMQQHAPALRPMQAPPGVPPGAPMSGFPPPGVRPMGGPMPGPPGSQPPRPMGVGVGPPGIRPGQPPPGLHPGGVPRPMMGGPPGGPPPGMRPMMGPPGGAPGMPPMGGPGPPRPPMGGGMGMPPPGSQPQMNGGMGPPVAGGPPVQQMQQMSMGGPPMRPMMGGPPPMGGRPMGPGPPMGGIAMQPHSMHPPPMGAPPMGAPLNTPSASVPPMGAPPMGAPPQQQRGYPPQPVAQQQPAQQPAQQQPQQQGAGGPGPVRIDPSQIPRPLPVHEVERPVFYETRVSGMAAQAPPASSNYVVRDTGNCSPRFMRSTLGQIPATGDLLNTSGMSLAVLVQPMALQEPDELPVELVDFGQMGPVRCGRCKAYVNPFMRFVDAGRRVQCNFCGHVGDVPTDYYCSLGGDGRRRDADERPELSRGTVEFAASGEYMVRPPMPPVYFFAIDVSYAAVSGGVTEAACQAVRAALGGLAGGARARIAIATFDRTLHCYNLRPSQPVMLVVPNVADVYCPLQEMLVVNADENRAKVEALLDQIPGMFKGTRVGDGCGGAALQGAIMALKPTGGKLLLFQSSLPTVGMGRLKDREGRSGGGVTVSSPTSAAVAEREAQKMLQPAEPLFRKMAIEAAEYQVCIDLFLMGQGYMDVASLGVLPHTTGGTLYHYHPFSPVLDGELLREDLRWCVSRPQGLEAVMRVRCSQGLSVAEYQGAFCKRTATDVDLPAIDCDKAVLVALRHDEKLSDTQEAYIQCALLYTTVGGERRIRVHTMGLPCTSVMGNLFRSADLDAQFACAQRAAAQLLVEKPLAAIREAMLANCVSALYTYRKFCATASSSGQLILPEALKLLPLYTLALNKSAGLRADTRADTRAAWMLRVMSLPCGLAVPLVYPRLLACHSLLGRPVGAPPVPPALSLTSEKLDPDGVFLSENGRDAFIWVGKQCAPMLLEHFFGVRSAEELGAEGGGGSGPSVLLRALDNEASAALVGMVTAIRGARRCNLRLRILRRSDPLEAAFFATLVEDRSQSGMSYIEFLCHVHRCIQNRMN